MTELEVALETLQDTEAFRQLVDKIVWQARAGLVFMAFVIPTLVVGGAVALTRDRFLGAILLVAAAFFGFLLVFGVIPDLMFPEGTALDRLF